MTANRLKYETLAGNLSPTDTFKQLLEQLRLAEEDARKLSNISTVRNDIAKAKAWTAFANNFHQIQLVLTSLATGKAPDKSTVGYIGNA